MIGFFHTMVRLFASPFSRDDWMGRTGLSASVMIAYVSNRVNNVIFLPVTIMMAWW